MAEKAFRYIFGPVPSRRLGRSLGIDPVPLKTCSFDCVYCQIGRTTTLTTKRRPYVSTQAIVADLQRWLEMGGQADYLTLSGSGEPTLNSEVGEILRWGKADCEVPVAVLTNGSLLRDGAVRRQLSQADVLIPSLDAALPASFERVNRPCRGLTLDRIVGGLVMMREQFGGKFWLEVMLVDGLNTSERDLRALAEAVARISPDKVEVTTVVRPPAEAFARPVSTEQLRQACEILGPLAEIVGPSVSAAAVAAMDEHLSGAILELLRRRPCRITDVAAGLGAHPNEVAKAVHHLLSQGLIERVEQDAKTYLRPTKAPSQTNEKP